MGFWIGNHYVTENREFQSIAFRIDSNCVHSSYPYPFYIQINKSSHTLFFMSLVAKVFDVCVFNLSYSKYTKVYQYSLFNKNKVVVKWRIKRENLFGPFSANLLLSALYTLFDNKQSKSNFSLTYSSVYNDRMPVCVHCRPRSIACCPCKSWVS